MNAELREGNISQDEQASIVKKPGISRRDLLKASIYLGTASAVSIGGANVLKPEIYTPLKTNNKEIDIDKKPSPNSQATLGRTIMDATIFNMAEVATMPLAAHLNLPVGNAGMMEASKQHREDKKEESADADNKSEVPDGKMTRRLILGAMLGFAEMTIAAPIKEEFVYRNIPSYIIKDPSRVRWDAGLVSSLLFAYRHNFYRGKDKKINFAKDKIPLYQFTGGLFNWWIMRKRGYLHAVTAHATTNTTLFPLSAIMTGLMPGKMRERYVSHVEKAQSEEGSSWKLRNPKLNSIAGQILKYI